MKNKVGMIGQKITIAIGILLSIFLCFSFGDNIVLTGSASYTFVMPDFDVKLLAVSKSSETENKNRIIRWGWDSLIKDKCPNGDYSDSYYDRICDAPIKTGNKHNSSNYFEYDELRFNPKYSDEMNKAYQFAYYYWITTKESIDLADMNGKLTRIAMAKMLSQYAINVLGKTPDRSLENVFSDVSEKLDLDYDNGVTLAYQLGIMGINMGDKFRPNSYVTRAEFVTALSRLLYSMSDGKYAGTSLYYTNHMNKLYNEGIITNTDPTIFERRGYVMLMLMRSAENGGE